jgi:methylthioribose-1-phosphate isomerase
MKIDGTPYRTIWPNDDGSVSILDQTRLPHAFETLRLTQMAEAAHAIKVMQVRGAPLIGAAAAYGMALAMQADASDASLAAGYETLFNTRPTAINLRWALDDMRQRLLVLPVAERAAAAWNRAAVICDEDVAICESIGDHGLRLIQEAAANKPGETVNILTHCNAGWVATVDWGTALAPIYKAHDAGIPVHVWVDETRPRNQGASLTAWELGKHGVPHTLIVDSAGGHYMQHGLVDLCIVGTDRTTSNGDVCNKIGTYLKALAAHANDVPFYVALPSPTVDWTLNDGFAIPIEERPEHEVTEMWGKTPEGVLTRVRITPETTPGGNPAFDVTPANLVTALITERGICQASTEGLAGLFPELAAVA